MTSAQAETLNNLLRSLGQEATFTANGLSGYTGKISIGKKEIAGVLCINKEGHIVCYPNFIKDKVTT